MVVFCFREGIDSGRKNIRGKDVVSFDRQQKGAGMKKGRRSVLVVLIAI
jgi:hypothetical protein